MQQIQTQPKITKMTKKLRKTIILENILNGTFNRQELTVEMGCSDRAFRRDLSEIAEELGAPINDQMKVLRAICAEKLTIYAALEKLSPETMAKLLIAGEARKVELKEEITKTETVNINVKSMLAEYSKLLTPPRTEDKPVSPNSSS